MTSIDSNAALSATPCSLEHENVATVRRLTAMRSSRNLMSMAVLHLRSMLIAACKGGYSTPRDSYALVTQSNVDGNAAFAAAACSLEHARAATVRRVTATRSSRHLSMAMLRWQQRSMLIGACNGGSTAPRLCPHHTICRGQCCVSSNSMLTGSFNRSYRSVRRFTAMRSSHYLSMAMLRWQQQHAHCSMQVHVWCHRDINARCLGWHQSAARWQQ